MLVALGDSLTRGFNGQTDNLTGTYPQILSTILNEKVINQGVDGASIAGPYLGDLTSQFQNTHFPQYDGAIIEFGTNDYGHGRANLDQVTHVLQKNLQWLQKNYPKLKLWGILPLRRFDNYKNDDQIKGIGGYTFQELLDALSQVYHQQNIPVLNWEKDVPNLITNANFKTRLADKHLHPTKATYKLMAQAIAKFIQDTNRR